MNLFTDVEILARYEPLVQKAARRYLTLFPRSFEHQDLTQIGRSAVLKEYRNYNPARTKKPVSTFLWYRVRWAILKALREQDSVYKSLTSSEYKERARVIENDLARMDSLSALDTYMLGFVIDESDLEASVINYLTFHRIITDIFPLLPFIYQMILSEQLSGTSPTEIAQKYRLKNGHHAVKLSHAAAKRIRELLCRSRTKLERESHCYEGSVGKKRRRIGPSPKTETSRPH